MKYLLHTEEHSCGEDFAIPCSVALILLTPQSYSYPSFFYISSFHFPNQPGFHVMFHTNKKAMAGKKQREELWALPALPPLAALQPSKLI